MALGRGASLAGAGSSPLAGISRVGRKAGGGSKGLASGRAAGLASGLGIVIILPQAVHLAFAPEPLIRDGSI